MPFTPPLVISWAACGGQKEKLVVVPVWIRDLRVLFWGVWSPHASPAVGKLAQKLERCSCWCNSRLLRLFVSDDVAVVKA